MLYQKMSCILLTTQSLILSRVGTGSARDGANVESGADSLSEGPPRPHPPEPDSSDRQSHNLNVPDAPPNYDRATTDAATTEPPPPAYDSLYPPESPGIAKEK